MQLEKVKVIECPRDAMQGLHHFIPTDAKVAYINKLLKAGFDTIDAGSFVSPKAIPQMRDTAEVFKRLELASSVSKLLAIIANLRGAEEAVKFDEVTYLGFPFSISETFQLRNTNSTIEQSLHTVEALQNLCVNNNKQLVVYLSMAFGNPYGDKWNAGIALQWTEKIASQGVKIISLADTVGLASSQDVDALFHEIIPAFTNVEIGAHLHCKPGNWREKVEAAVKNGCCRFDTAIKGFGGCPMANDELTGNLATENLVQYLDEKKIAHAVDSTELDECIRQSLSIFNPLVTE